jgi:hypothetical protein
MNVLLKKKGLLESFTNHAMLTHKWKKSENIQTSLLLKGWDHPEDVNCDMTQSITNLKRHSYNILNHSKWRKFEKDLSKCLMID